MRRRILFIVNPITGKYGIEELKKLCGIHLEGKGFEWHILKSQYSGHAGILASEHMNDYDIVVAVGGDGTINEIARNLIGTEISLAIVPNGSGNGLARHLGISLNMNNAIIELRDSQEIKIDIIRANGIPFFNVAGIGFDAHVAKIFQNSQKRGLITYIKISAREFFKFKHPFLTIDTKSEKLECRKTFSLTVANGSQLGNNAYVARDARLDDGKMNFCLIEKYPIYYLPIALFRLFTGSLHKSKYYSGAVSARALVSVEGENSTLIQIDGEPLATSTPVHFEVERNALSILIPKSSNHR